MIKNKNLQTGLLVFVVTLIGLIAFAQYTPKNSLDIIENKIEKTNLKEYDSLNIAFH